MFEIVGIAGSLRRASINAGLLRAAQASMPPGARLAIHQIRQIPLYDGDLETAQGIPAAVAALKEAIAAADGLLIATPEYNASIPGVLKNAIDWLSRPASDIGRVFGGKPVALIGASPGGLGTALSQTAWLPVLRLLRARLWTGGQFTVPRAGGLFDGDGNLIDPGTREKLGAYLAAFVTDIGNGAAGED